MATRYWVGGTGTWNATSTTNWAASSGGASGASAPTSADDVVFDVNSNVTTTAFVVTFSGTQASPSACASFTASGLDGAMTLTGGSATAWLEVYGNVSFPATNMSVSGSGSFVLRGAGSQTLTTNGVSLAALNLISYTGTGTYTLGSALTLTGIIDWQYGNFDTSASNYAVTAGNITLQGTQTRTITLNASAVTLANAAPFTYSGSNVTLSAGTSTISCSSTASGTFAGGGLTFYNVSFTGSSSSTITISGANTYNNLTFTTTVANTVQVIAFGANQVINGTLTVGAANTAVRRTFLRSDTTGTARTLTLNGTLAALTDVDFRDITAAGTVATPWTGTRLGNCLGNSNITFAAGVNKYWNLVGGGSITGTAWATTSGGVPAANNFPLAQDTIIIENTGLNTSATVTVNGGFNLGSVNMSTRSNAMTFSTAAQNPIFYGSITLSSAVTVLGLGALTFAGQGTTQTITSAGEAFTQTFIVDAPSGTFTLADNLDMSANNLTITGASGTGTTATLTFAAQATTPYAVNNTIFVTGMTPAGYNGLYTITAVTTTSVSYANTTTGAMTVAGEVWVNRNFTLTRGTLALANNTLTTRAFSSSNANTRAVTFGTGKIVCNGAGQAIVSQDNATGFTYTGTPRVELTYSGSVGTRQLTPNGTGATETNVLNYYITAGTDTFQINSNRSVGTLDFTGFSGTLASFGTTDVSIYGSLKFSTGMSFALFSSGDFNFKSTSGTKLITSNGKPFPTGVTLSGLGGTWQLQDALTISNGEDLKHTAGTLDLNNYTATIGGDYSSQSSINTRAITFGTGQIYVAAFINASWYCDDLRGFSYTGSGNVVFPANAVIDHGSTAGTPAANNILNYTWSGTLTIFSGSKVNNLTQTASGSLTFATTYIYGNLTLASGSTTSGATSFNLRFTGSGSKTITTAGVTINCTITFEGAGGSWTFQDALTQSTSYFLTFTDGTIALKSGVTSTFSLSTSGTTLKYLRSSTPGTQATISDASGTNTVTYLDIQDSNATGGATWDATSPTNVNSGNNTGWNFGTIIYSDSIVEVLISADASSAQSVFSDSVTENSTLADTNSAATVLVVTITENLTPASIQAAASVFAAAQVEASTLNNTQSATGTFAAASVENSGLANTQSVAAVFNSTRVENSGLADTQAVSAVFQVFSTEGSTLADSEAAVKAFASSIVEGLTAANVQATITVFTGAVIEPSTLASVQAVQASFNSTRIENLTLADIESALATLYASRLENAALASTQSTQATLNTSVTENTNLADIAAAQAAFNAAVTEATSINDLVVAAKTLAATITENSDIADDSSVFLVVNAELIESLISASSTAVQANFNTNLVENMVLSDQLVGYGWFRVVDDQTVVWTNVNNTQSVTWSNVGDDQNPNWVEIDNKQP